MNKPVLPAENQKKFVNDIPTAVGNVRRTEYPAPKTSGIKMRGTGAATKGTMSRGPMA